MFLAWGRFAYRFRHIVPFVIIGLIVALYLLAGTKLGERMSQEGWDDPGSSSTRAAQIEQEVFGRDNRGDVLLLVTAESVDDPATYAAVGKHLQSLQADHPDEIAQIDSYFATPTGRLTTEDRRMAFATIGLKGEGEDVLKNFRKVEADLTDVDLPDGTMIEVAGSTAIADALDEGMAGDIKRAELYALPAVALLLLFVFGSFVASTMPLIVGVLSILGSLGVLSLLATQTQVNVFAQSVVTLLGLGLAIDYGLFMVSRFREELDSGAPVNRAVATTTATAGTTVVFSAGMVAVALSGLLLFPQAFLKSVAYGAISAVGLAALLSITVLPSLFGLLGTNIDKGMIRKPKNRSSDWEDTIWARIPTWAMKHAKKVTFLGVALLVFLTLPLFGVKFGGINETYLPPSNEVRVAQEKFDENFPIRTEPIKLVITGADEQGVVSIYQQASAIEGLTGVFGASRPTKEGTTVLSTGIANRADYGRVVNELRKIEAPDNVTIYIGGTPALEVESIEALLSTLPWMSLYIVAATFVLMALVFGSIILPAKAVIMTILGLGTTLGVLTMIFVDGLGSGILGFTAGPLMSPVLVLIMAIVYGLSTDYEVFLVSRMVESRNRGSSTDTAIRYGTAHTGGIITAAAVIMIVVCGAFGFSNIVMMKYIAFGMIVALFLDATLIRMLLVPAVMHLLRDDNWWAPAPIQRAAELLGHGGPPTAREVKEVPMPRAVDTQEELPLHSAAIDDDDTAMRGGRNSRDDAELIPFSVLMARHGEGRS
ncbi:MMPL family transporter [Corynebacterium canis]|uniref:MMPL family transporter n=1 Tax=Corynebacterium canis TaxID=679663 RepID=A0A5C5UIT0_9CORY|nr:MMPL family transporter [Corynebacterium canis]TWT26631.1 MMPL family transporter [Corynebacterium canis]WJY76416.1 Membrane protein YdfJ [Corynebacterium canis]